MIEMELAIIGGVYAFFGLWVLLVVAGALVDLLKAYTAYWKSKAAVQERIGQGLST